MITDERVTAYIGKAQLFAQPILEEIRERMHECCPAGEEALKWQMPNFLYKGKILSNMAAFKKHCAFGFWLGPIMNPEFFSGGAMGDLGKLTSVEDLPSKEIFRAMVQEAMELIDAGRTVPKKEPVPLTASDIPQEVTDALKQNAAAEIHFNQFPPSHKKEYIEWIREAKTDATRQKRIAQMLEWVSEGKSRNWKYQ